MISISIRYSQIEKIEKWHNTLCLASSALRWYSSALGSTGELSKALVSTSHWAWALYRSWNSLASSNARCRKLCSCLSPPASSSSWARRASTSPPKLSAPASSRKPAACSARSLRDFRKLWPCWSSDWRVWVKERAEILQCYHHYCILNDLQPGHFTHCWKNTITVAHMLRYHSFHVFEVHIQKHSISLSFTSSAAPVTHTSLAVCLKGFEPIRPADTCTARCGEDVEVMLWRNHSE